MVTKPKPLIVILGETASGKSDLALELAKKFEGEIINADSWVVYKGFDIGTAKPSKAEQASIKHHLIDIADPKVGFNAAEFKRKAAKLIDDINKSDHLPILVGGTGLYIDSVLYDYSFLPVSSPEVRNEYNQMSLNELTALVRQFNYDVTGIDLNNKRRVIRLIENKGLRPSANTIRKDTLIIGKKITNEDLINNITNRVNRMINDGLENEVYELSKLYNWDIEPMKGIGYREFKQYFDGSRNLEETKQLIINNSLNLAKKQRTWFKRNKSIQWVDNSSNVVGIVTTFLNNLDTNS